MRQTPREHSLNNPYLGYDSRMRIGIVSDLHGNLAGLDMALDRMGAVRRDLVCGGCLRSVSVLQRRGRTVERAERALRPRQSRADIARREGSAARARPDVDADLLAWVESRPTFIEQDILGVRLLMFHSTPWAPYGAYVYPHSPELSRFGDVPADVVIYGHTHSQVAATFNDTLVINPGSAGLGQDPRNGRQLSYAVFDAGSGTVEFDNFENPTIGRRASPD